MVDLKKERQNGDEKVPPVLLLQGVQASLDLQNLQVNFKTAIFSSEIIQNNVKYSEKGGRATRMQI